MHAPQFKRQARHRLKSSLLAEREKQYQLLANHSLDMISRHTPDGVFTYVSPVVHDLLGYLPSQVIGRSIYDFFHADDISDMRVAHEALLRYRTPYLSTYRMRSQDGSYIWFETTVSLIEDADGAVEEIIAVSRDITARKEVEKALYENITLFRSLFEFASEGIILLNKTGNIVLVNSRVEAMFGYTRFELLGQRIEILLPPELRTAHQGHRASYGLHPEVRAMGIGLEVQAQRKDGSLFPVEVSLSPVKIEEGEMVMALVTDITQRKIIEQQVRTTSEQMKTIFDNLDQVFFSLDAVENKMLQISEACERIYGVSVQAFMENPYVLRAHILPEDLPQVIANDAQIAAGKVVTSVFRIQHPVKKEIRWLEAKIKPKLDQTGKLIRIDGIVADITERRQAARLAVAGEIATGVAHQINNPLTTVIAETHLLTRHFMIGSPEQEALQEIQTAAYRAGSIVQRLLNLARAHVGTMMRLNINNSLQTAIGLLRPQLQPYVTHLSIEFTPDLPLILGSEEHLQDVWVNLLLNARDAVTGVAQPMIRIGTALGSEPQTLAITVADNGDGICPEHLDHIFDPFYTTKEQGAGLGLSICHDVIVHHGGRIRVQSEVGVGTTFTIILPIGVLHHDFSR